MLNYQIKNDLTSIASEEWNNLLKDSDTATVFQTKEYLTAWSEAFLNDKSEVLIVMVYDDKELIGIAPLRFRRSHLVQGATLGQITFLGTDSVGKRQDLVTDFGDIVAEKGREKEVWEEVLKALRETKEVQEIVLDYVRESSPSFSVLKEKGHEINEMIDNTHPDVAPYLDLPKTWEEYLGQLGRKGRHELRRKLRRLEEHGYTIEKVEQVAQVGQVEKEEAIKEFIRLHKTSTVEKDRFMTSQMAEFFTKMTNNLSSKNLVDLTFMRFGQENVAVTFSFLWNNEYWLYNSGFDRKYENLAVGFLLKALTVKMAIEKGYQCYSFLRGNERYKYDLGAIDEKLYKVVIRL